MPPFSSSLVNRRNANPLKNYRVEWVTEGDQIAGRMIPGGKATLAYLGPSGVPNRQVIGGRKVIGSNNSDWAAFTGYSNTAAQNNARFETPAQIDAGWNPTNDGYTFLTCVVGEYSTAGDSLRNTGAMYCYDGATGYGIAALTASYMQAGCAYKDELVGRTRMVGTLTGIAGTNLSINSNAVMFNETTPQWAGVAVAPKLFIYGFRHNANQNHTGFWYCSDAPALQTYGIGGGTSRAVAVPTAPRLVLGCSAFVGSYAPGCPADARTAVSLMIGERLTDTQISDLCKAIYKGAKLI